MLTRSHARSTTSGITSYRAAIDEAEEARAMLEKAAQSYQRACFKVRLFEDFHSSGGVCQPCDHQPEDDFLIIRPKQY